MNTEVDKIMSSADIVDAMEVRNMLKTLSTEVKTDIAKGMAMFEAGYKSGFIDGIVKREKGCTQQSA